MLRTNIFFIYVNMVLKGVLCAKLESNILFLSNDRCEDPLPLTQHE